MKKLTVTSKMSLNEQRTRLSVNDVIEKCGNDTNRFRNWLLNQVTGLKDKDGDWLIFPNTMSYEQANRYYREATA